MDLNGNEWTPIGMNEPFSGTFDGQGHVISNLTLTEAKTCYGLFSTVYYGVVQNLGVVDVNMNVPAESNMLRNGVLVSWLHNATIRNCYTTGNVTAAYGWAGLGGIVGGIASDAGSVSVIENCRSYVNIKSYLTDVTNCIGGIVGQIECYGGTAEIKNNAFSGTISGTGAGCLYGGIIGAGFDGNAKGNPVVSVENCFFNGEISFSGEESEAAQIGFVEGPVNNCYWRTDCKHPGAKIIAVDAVGNVTDGNSAWLKDSCQAVEDFQSQEFLDLLNKNAGKNLFIMGMDGPTLPIDVFHIAADYSKVDAAIAKAEALNQENYKDFSAVEAAIAAVIRDKDSTEQAEVDAMALAIEDAIAALEYKDADYSKVDAAIAKAEALNQEDYKDFSAVEAAMTAVIRGKDITEQAEVDAMAQAIEDAITALEKKPAESVPGEPSETNPEDESQTSTPQTGDENHSNLWVVLMLLAAGGIALSVKSFHKKVQG